MAAMTVKGNANSYYLMAVALRPLSKWRYDCKIIINAIILSMIYKSAYGGE